MRVHFLSAAPGWLLLSLLAVGLSLPLQAKPRLSVAWSHWPPFSYINPQGTLDGLDVTLTRQILSQAGLESHFRNLPWARAIHLLEQQQLDVAMGALDTPERRAFARFSVPYRRSTFVLLSNNPIPGQRDPWLAVSDLSQLCQQSQLRLGKLRGTRPIQLMEACPALKNASEYNADDRLVDLLLARRLDGVIMEWQYARYRLQQLGADGFIRCQLLLHHQPVSLMFASSAVTDAQLARVNEVIASLPPPGRDVAPPPCRLDNPAAEQVTPNQ
ncbi:substrate-binding periplasmic protein [Aeromonas hydrophila]|uniref:substrate-binding periplasmic protein n=1 Tax=Aeromonas hydrophila TaxID=644 RepID=UPI0014559440|nr:transporter substrate-binding domain-containing protein [Aeromonas hydrophila]NLR37026.1 amino acid ABC transporter substrate-binding protein [Aeromonas hydrophila]